MVIEGGVINQPEDAKDVKGQVTSDYQDVLEKAWLSELKKKYPAKINRKVLQQVKPQHLHPYCVGNQHTSSHKSLLIDSNLMKRLLFLFAKIAHWAHSFKDNYGNLFCYVRKIYEICIL